MTSAEGKEETGFRKDTNILFTKMKEQKVKLGS